MKLLNRDGSWGMVHRSLVVLIAGTSLIFSQTSCSQAAQSNSVKIPHAVTGLSIVANDPLVRSITLSWNPNPKADGVDKYAIYVLNSGLDGAPPELVTTSARTKVSLKTWYGNIRNQPKGTVFVIPNYHLVMFVIAHNKFGWGAGWPGTTYPDASKGPSMSRKMYQVYGPTQAFGYWKCTSEIEKFYSTKCS